MPLPEDGLAGNGAAKAWSWSPPRYEVRWEALVAFVQDAFNSRRLPVGGGVGGPLFQMPQDDARRGVLGSQQRNPLLATCPPQAISNEQLDVLLAPDDVVHVAEVEVRDGGGALVDQRSQLTGLPVGFSLPPKTYLVAARAPDYDEARALPPVELYARLEVPLTLNPTAGGGDASAIPAADPDAPKPAPSPAEPDDSVAVARDIPAEPAPAEDATAGLAVRAEDALAVLDVLDERGRVVAAAQGELALETLHPGFYRARLTTPEGVSTQEVVHVAPGTTETVTLPAPGPPPAVRTIVKDVGGEVADGNVTVAAEVGPIADAAPSTILTLAAGAAIQGDRLPWTAGLRSLGLSPIQEVLGNADAGVQVVIALGPDDDLARTRVRLWPIGRAVPDASAPRGVRAAVGEVVAAAEPQAHWLSIEPHEAQPIVLALTVLRGRISTVVAQVERVAIQLFQYLPALTPDDSSDPRRLRRVEALERLLLGGRIDAALKLALELAPTAAEDPLAGALAGYTLLRASRVAEVEEPALVLTQRYRQFSDGHVLAGEHAASAGHAEAAKKAFTSALETGPPAFGDGLARLVQAMQEYELDHANGLLVRHLFDKHVSGTMWSAFAPPAVEPGEVLLATADAEAEARKTMVALAGLTAAPPPA